MAKKRSFKSMKDELVKKSREAMLAAVQIYNNPAITFKSESYITLCVIAWTYLLHAFYRSKNIDYRFAVFPVSVITQLIAYYTSIEKGLDVDKPRNLAKSVTVE